MRSSGTEERLEDETRPEQNERGTATRRKPSLGRKQKKIKKEREKERETISN